MSLVAICSQCHGRELWAALVKPPIRLLGEASVCMLACSVITKGGWDISFSVSVMLVMGGGKEGRQGGWEAGKEEGGIVSNHFIPSFKRPSGLWSL